LRLYQRILTPNGRIHLKTDSPVLYAFTKMVIDMYGLTLHNYSENIYAGPVVEPELQIITYYESLDIAKSKQVYYISFSLPQNELPFVDHILQERVKENEATVD